MRVELRIVGCSEKQEKRGRRRRNLNRSIERDTQFPIISDDLFSFFFLYVIPTRLHVGNSRKINGGPIKQRCMSSKMHQSSIFPRPQDDFERKTHLGHDIMWLLMRRNSTTNLRDIGRGRCCCCCQIVEIGRQKLLWCKGLWLIVDGHLRWWWWRKPLVLFSTTPFLLLLPFPSLFAFNLQLE